MNKADLIDQIAEKTQTSKAAAARVFEAIFDASSGAIAEAVQAGKHVSIPGFGKFRSKERAARKGRNPQTGTEIDIPASTVVSFAAAKTLRETVKTKPGSSSAARAGAARSGGAGGAAKSSAQPAKSTSAAKTPARSAAAKSAPAKSASKSNGASRTTAEGRSGGSKAPSKTAAKSVPAKTASKSAPAKSSGGPAKKSASKR